MSEQARSHARWLSRLNEHLENERYASGTARHCVAVARVFLAFLQDQGVRLSSVQPTQVEKYLQYARRRFRRRYGHEPTFKGWRFAHTAPVHMLLRLAHGQWPPNPKPVTRAEKLQHQICQQYVGWMVDIRGLAPATVSDRRKEACRFLGWLGRRAHRVSLATLTVADVDGYLKERLSSWRRSSIKTATVWLRIFLHWLHSMGHMSRDLSTAVVGPSLYAFAGVPSALRPEDVKKVLEVAQRDQTTQGLRDYAILLLLARYGVRASEVAGLRLEDIDWRKEAIRVGHTKTGAVSHLPLLPEVGNAILEYLQKARPQTAFREIFIRERAPYRPLRKGAGLHTLVRRRVDAAGVVTAGRRGPHAFRHALAVSLLQAAVPLKEIGDLLGHRSANSTMVYLKLATEDLRAIALEIPGEVKA